MVSHSTLASQRQWLWTMHWCSSQTRGQDQHDSAGWNQHWNDNAGANSGVTLDSMISFDKQVGDICRISLYHVRAFRRIRKLPEADAKTVVAAVIWSRIGYCNSLIFDTSVKNINQLQRIQNSVARLVVDARWSTPSSFMPALQWLPIPARIEYK